MFASVRRGLVWRLGLPLALAGAAVVPAGPAVAGPAGGALVVHGQLYGVAAVSAGDVWAVGRTHFFRTLVMHWNGAAWRRVPSPSFSSNEELTGVAAVGARQVWAVGYTVGYRRQFQTLI